MAKTVQEIMNAELFSVRTDDTAADALGFILALDITGAAVVDDDHRPIGMVTMRDLVRAGAGKLVEHAMTSPAITIAATATIIEAAQKICDLSLHRLVVTDASGAAIGMLSALDVVAGLAGLPARHPAPFPHYDREVAVCWSDDAVLELERAGLAPDGPGVLVLIHGKAGVPERVVWAEGCHNVRTRIEELLSVPQSEPMLARALRLGELRFRTASIPDAAERERVVLAVQGKAMAALQPAPTGLA